MCEAGARAGSTPAGRQTCALLLVKAEGREGEQVGRWPPSPPCSEQGRGPSAVTDGPRARAAQERALRRGRRQGPSLPQLRQHTRDWDGGSPISRTQLLEKTSSSTKGLKRPLPSSCDPPAPSAGSPCCTNPPNRGIATLLRFTAAPGETSALTVMSHFQSRTRSTSLLNSARCLRTCFEKEIQRQSELVICYLQTGTSELRSPAPPKQLGRDSRQQRGN